METIIEDPTIEDKLSAIKAINEEKDSIEKMLSHLSRMAGIPNVKAQLHFEGDFTRSVLLPSHVMKVCIEECQKSYSTRKQELIDKAKELMK